MKWTPPLVEIDKMTGLEIFKHITILKLRDSTCINCTSYRKLRKHNKCVIDYKYVNSRSESDICKYYFPQDYEMETN